MISTQRHIEPIGAPPLAAGPEGWGGGVSFAEFVLPWANARTARGQRVALVTLVAVDGSSPRPVGSQMAVCETGEAIGNITGGGCAEAAIVTEALEALRTATNRRLRYGKGSPFFDIRLPCGSGIDVYINATIEPNVLLRAEAMLTARQPVTLVQDMREHESWIEQGEQSSADADRVFHKVYQPAFRIVAIGKGPVLSFFCRMGQLAGFEMTAVSTDAGTLDEVRDACTEQTLVPTPRDYVAQDLDRWSAAVLLFHDHEWEPAILARILETPCAYVGALGSRRTHAQRVQTLAHMGVSPSNFERIHAPVGLDIGASSPPEIAVSILAEIIAARRKTQSHAAA